MSRNLAGEGLEKSQQQQRYGDRKERVQCVQRLDGQGDQGRKDEGKERGQLLFSFNQKECIMWLALW